MKSRLYISPSNVDQVNGKLKWNDNVRAIIDPRLGSKYPVDEYKRVMEIAIQCTTYDRNDRPKMQVSINTYIRIYKHTNYVHF